MTLAGTLNNLEIARQLLIVSAAGAVLWFVYKGTKGALNVIDDATTTAAGAWVDFNNPLISAQIRIKSQYFIDGVLTNDAFDVISAGYPNLYKTAFENRRLKPDFMYLLNGDAVTDDLFI
jgi:hypothetical protein